MAVPNREIQASAEFESILAEAFRKAGWRSHRPPDADSGVDLIIDGKERKYVVQLKVSSEGRSDRLIPLLSQAILEIQVNAQRFGRGAVPLAVVASKHVPLSVAERIRQFAQRNAPAVGVGVIDASGLHWFAGPGLEGLDSKPARQAARAASAPQPLPGLFSDLNQWMLKILLGQRLPESLVSVPREPIRNASHLAQVANVSVMSASRFVNQLAKEGFLDEDGGQIAAVRSEDLLERWVSANRAAARDIPARWIIKQDEKQFLSKVVRYASSAAGKVMKPRLRCCLGVFAAADALGVGFVRGVPQHLYLERPDVDAMNQLGIVAEDSDGRADIYVRVPSNKESVFRALVVRDDLPVSDVLQVWLDASVHPTRGREQADQIRRSVLRPLFGKSK